jgi:hypothetical protein
MIVSQLKPLSNCLVLRVMLIQVSLYFFANLMSLMFVYLQLRMVFCV